MKKKFAKLSSTASTKIKMKMAKWQNFEIPYFFNTLCTFWPNSIHFQSLEDQFYNLILF